MIRVARLAIVGVMAWTLLWLVVTMFFRTTFTTP